MSDKRVFEGADPEISTMFRYLGLKHRAENPLNQEHYDIEEGHKALLDRAICDSAARFMNFDD